MPFHTLYKWFSVYNKCVWYAACDYWFLFLKLSSLCSWRYSFEAKPCGGTSHTIKITLENEYRSILRTIRKIHQSKRLTMKWIFRSYEICMFMTRRIWTLRMLRSSGTIFLKTINNSIIITILLAELNNDHGVQFTSHWLRFYLNCDFIVPTLLCSSIEHTGNY